jgi:hypothetical protein
VEIQGWEENIWSPSRGWRVILCCRMTTSPTPQEMPIIFGGAIGWARICSLKSFMAWESSTPNWGWRTTPLAWLASRWSRNAPPLWRCWHMEHLPMHNTTTFAWVSPLPLNAHTSFAELWWKSLAHTHLHSSTYYHTCCYSYIVLLPTIHASYVSFMLWQDHIFGSEHPRLTCLIYASIFFSTKR